MAIRREKATREDIFHLLPAALPVSLRRNPYLNNRSRLLEELAKELKRVLNRRPD